MGSPAGAGGIVAAMRGALLPAVVLAAAAACYRPSIPAGAPCEETSECPEGQACIEGRCGGDPAAPDGPPGTVVLVVGDDRSQLRDTEVAGYAPNQNFNDQDHVSVDSVETSLIWFDLSGAPAGLVLAAATLELSTTDDADENGGTVLVHRMLEGWDENEVTWNERTENVPWLAPGAAPPSREAAPIAEVRPDRERARFSVSLPLEVVRAWLADPATNFGLALVRGTSQQHVHFGVREATRWSKLTLELRP